MKISRKTWVATADAFFSVCALVATYFLERELVEEVLALILILQPLVIVWINALVKEDLALFYSLKHQGTKM